MTGRILDIDQDSLARAADVVRAGRLVVIPTDTVYGVVCDPFNDAAIDALFAAKHRPRSKSLQVLLPSVETIDQLELTLPNPLERLADIFLPGAFSPICLAQDGCRLKTLRSEPDSLTQAVRVPDSYFCQQVLAVTGPLAASSANLSGQPSVQSAQEAFDQLGDSVDLYLDGGLTQGPVPSTVVSADAQGLAGIRIEREGAIAADHIYRALGMQSDRQQGPETAGSSQDLLR